MMGIHIKIKGWCYVATFVRHTLIEKIRSFPRFPGRRESTTFSDLDLQWNLLVCRERAGFPQRNNI